MSKHEVNWSVSEKELLAIVLASKYIKCYIFGRFIRFFTYNQPLSDFKQSGEPDGRLYRLMRKLVGLNYEIIHIPGVLNTTADMLSRPNGVSNTATAAPVIALTAPSSDTDKVSNVISINTLDVRISIDWAEEQDLDRELAIVKLNVKSNNDSTEYKGLDNYDLWKKNRSCLQVKDRTLYLRNKDNDDVIVVPTKLRTKICALYHDSLTAGHLGFEKTYNSISSKFYWPKMKIEVYNYCMSCDTCQKLKTTNQKQRAALVSIKVNKPWEIVEIDVAGPLKVTKLGNKCFIVAVDAFSKYCIVRAVPNQTADTTMKFLKEDLVSKHGSPYVLLSDQGRNFESKMIEEFCTKYGIKKICTTSYQPQCNGLAERTIRTLKQMASCYVYDDHDNWDEVLPDVVFAYNITKHSTTLVK